MRKTLIILLLGIVGLQASAQNTRVKWKQIMMGVNGQIAQVGTDGNGHWVAPKWVDTVYLRNDSLVVVAQGHTTLSALPNKQDFILDTLYNADGNATEITIYTHGAWITNIDVRGDEKNGSGYYDKMTDGDYTTIYYAHAPYGQIEYVLSGSGGDGRSSTILPSLQRPIATASGLTPTSNKVQWSAVPDAAGYEVNYSYNAATYNLLQAVSSNVLNITHSGLKPNTTVYYQVRALGDKETHSNSALSIASTATTFSLPPLDAPTASATASTTASSITIHWNSVTNAQGYSIDYSYDGINWDLLTTTAQNATSYTHPNLPASTTINYRVKALGDEEAFENSPYSDVVTATTAAAPTLAAPSVNIIAKTGNSISIAWDDIDGASGYEIQYSTDGVSYQGLQSVSANTTTITHTGITTATTIYYRVRALGNGTQYSTSDWSPPVSATTNALTLLATPQPSAVECGATCMSINWPAVPNALAYLLQYSTNNINWFLLDEIGTDSTNYDVNGLEPNTTYYIRVQAVADGITFGDSKFGVDSATTDAETTTSTSLATPTITATAISSSAITVTWSNVANESSYLLEKSLDRAIWTTAATPAANVTSFTLNALAASTKYYVRVQAIGNGTTFTSSGKATTSATTQTGVAFTPTIHGALLTTGSSANNITGLNNLGLDWARTAYNSNGPNATYSDYSAFKQLWNYNPANPNVNNTVTLSTDTADFACRMDSVLNEEGSTNIKAVCIINEPNNFGYWNTSAKNMLNLIRAATDVAHEHGFEAYDGGITGPIMNFMVYEDYIKRGFPDSAEDYKTRAFPSGTNPANWRTSSTQGPKIRFLDTLLAGLKDIPTDGINVHWYETVRDEDSLKATTSPLTFIQTARYLSRVTGKPAMSNEYGTNNNSTITLMQQQVDVVQQALHMKYAFWFSTPEHPLTNTNGTLTPLGNAYKIKIQQ
jgi:hypothetical protein